VEGSARPSARSSTGRPTVIPTGGRSGRPPSNRRSGGHPPCRPAVGWPSAMPSAGWSGGRHAVRRTSVGLSDVSGRPAGTDVDVRTRDNPGNNYYY
jgi:hypothetical protein